MLLVEVISGKAASKSLSLSGSNSAVDLDFDVDFDQTNAEDVTPMRRTL